MNDSEQKASTQDPKFMTITKFAWNEKVQQVDDLKQENQALADKYNNVVYALESKVEEMKKTLEWYAEMRAFPANYDTGERARQALKGVTHEQSN